jgi:superfamily II DNA or RNA helicase
LICTTQTAILAYNTVSLDRKGETQRTPFRKFIDERKKDELFIVIDEAHHVPAYGCRTMLLQIREEIPTTYILGLTATPAHSDKRISGWLNNIFNEGDYQGHKGICYQAEQHILEQQKILAVPHYIEKDTNIEREVDDSLFERIVYKHKDLPEEIIDELSNNQARNDFIVSDYVNNRNEYGKTIIFADRWYQCEYIRDKLLENSIKTDAVYSMVNKQAEIFEQGTGRRDNKYNDKVMEDFKKNALDVVVNVRMLTEGVDVPDVQTVMLTRQTTSRILFAQMVGRALRGEKAGGGKGKEHANIVLFHDNWKRLLPWVYEDDGDMSYEKSPSKKRNPMSLVSIALLRMALEDFVFEGFEGDTPFIAFIPVGFFNCEYTVSVSDGGEEEMATYSENTVAYEFNKEKYDKMIAKLLNDDLSEYASESVEEDIIKEYANNLITQFFEREKDGFDGQLKTNIEKIVRHIAQNETAPEFVDFDEREIYDVDRIAKECMKLDQYKLEESLRNTFNNKGQYWGLLYHTYEYFKSAVQKSIDDVLKRKFGKVAPHSITESEEGSKKGLELTPKIKEQLFQRDNYTCLCCGKARRKGVTLNADHILPISMGGGNEMSNLQTLCKYCNGLKGVNDIDYRVHSSYLTKPKDSIELIPPVGSDEDWMAIARIVNFFYRCSAVCEVKYHIRKSGKNYDNWVIVLYDGNNPEWLNPHIKELLQYIHGELRRGYVKSITVTN